MTDVVLINPGASLTIYQNLSEDLSAIEPSTWTRMIAGWLIDKRHDVAILDQDAFRWTPEEVAGHVEKINPRLVAIVVAGQQPSASTQQMTGASLLAKAIHGAPKIMVGNHPSALPVRTLVEEDVDYVCDGEGPLTISGLLNNDPLESIPGLVWKNGSVARNPRAGLIPIDELHGDVWGMLPMDRYRAHTWQCLDGGPRQPYASIYTTLGCPFKCLAGDTPINTIYGDIPIRELAERYGEGGVPVYTYDPETRRAFISDAVAIRKYGESEELVRVHFDDGAHIDCTPDHKFLQFKWGNGKSTGRQWECEAQNLPAWAHVRAIKTFSHPVGYATVSWGRRDRKRRNRMVMEYLMGRELLPFRYPAIGMLDKLGSRRARVRHQFRYPAIGMLDKLHENDVPGRIGFDAHKNKRVDEMREINHVVTHVERLTERGDVYCLTVPETGWFFANNVLVKNCSFCMINVFQHSNTYRRRTPEKVVKQVKHLYEVYGVKTLKIADEMFVLDPSHYLPICEGLAALPFASELNIWAYARIDTVKPETLSLMRRAGIRWLALGIESGSAHVRDGAIKSLDDDDIRTVVKAIQDAGINVIGNFIFGLPDDTMESMQATLTLAKELNCEFSNFYAAQAYPGSRLFDEADLKDLPNNWSGYSQHSFDTTPLPTKTLTSREVLQFRDDAFHSYFEDERYLNMIDRKFGTKAVEHIKQMTATRLRRAA